MADLLFTDCLKHIAHIPSSLSLLFFFTGRRWFGVWGNLGSMSSISLYLWFAFFSPSFRNWFSSFILPFNLLFHFPILAASYQSLSPLSICFCMRLFNLSSHIPLIWFSLFSPLGGRRTARAWGRLIHVFFFTFCLYFPSLSLFLSSLFFLLTTLDICSLALGPNLTYNTFIPDKWFTEVPQWIKYTTWHKCSLFSLEVSV